MKTMQKLNLIYGQVIQRGNFMMIKKKYQFQEVKKENIINQILQKIKKNIMKVKNPKKAKVIKLGLMIIIMLIMMKMRMKMRKKKIKKDKYVFALIIKFK